MSDRPANPTQSSLLAHLIAKWGGLCWDSRRNEAAAAFPSVLGIAHPSVRTLANSLGVGMDQVNHIAQSHIPTAGQDGARREKRAGSPEPVLHKRSRLALEVQLSEVRGVWCAGVGVGSAGSLVGAFRLIQQPPKSPACLADRRCRTKPATWQRTSVQWIKPRQAARQGGRAHSPTASGEAFLLDSQTQAAAFRPLIMLLTPPGLPLVWPCRLPGHQLSTAVANSRSGTADPAGAGQATPQPQGCGASSTAMGPPAPSAPQPLPLGSLLVAAQVGVLHRMTICQCISCFRALGQITGAAALLGLCSTNNGAQQDPAGLRPPDAATACSC